MLSDDELEDLRLTVLGRKAAEEIEAYRSGLLAQTREIDAHRRRGFARAVEAHQPRPPAARRVEFRGRDIF